MAKTKSSKRANSEAKDALKGLRSELKRLGKALSKQIRESTPLRPKKGNKSASGGEGVKTSAKRTNTKAKTAAKKTANAAKKAPAKKAPAKNVGATKASATKAPATKAPATKATAKKN